MIRWLSRYVKRIDVMGVGVELREIPADEAQRLLAPSRSAPEQPAAGSAPSDAPVVRREDYLCLSGTSASTQRAPRELDLMADGEEIQVHIHQPGGSQPKVWVGRQALAVAFAQGPHAGGGKVTVPARTARNEAVVAFVWDESDEVEVQAGWWIWVAKQDLTAALAELSIRAPWQ